MSSCCDSKKNKRDWFFIAVSSLVIIFYSIGLLSNLLTLPSYLNMFGHSVVELVNSMAFGVVLGLIVIGFIGFVPRNVVTKIMGSGDGVSGLLRATLAGLLLDLCSHGILMVGIKLYERGVSLAQVMAFLIASPWNSLSLTLILASLIGVPLTITFVLASALIALITGMAIRLLIAKNWLPSNPNSHEIEGDFKIWSELCSTFSGKWTQPTFYIDLFKNSMSEGKMVIRWLFFGILMASVLRSFLSPDQFEAFLGPSIGGMFLTLLMATILEVCSEGSVPIAADLVTMSKAPGNSFLFLMSGVSTDYTEIMSIKEVTKSWACAFILPILTLPQILVISYILNTV